MNFESIPQAILERVRTSSEWIDGDCWPIGDGRVIEFIGERGGEFVLRRGEKILARKSHRWFLRSNKQ